MIDLERYRIQPGSSVRLSEYPSEEDGGLKKNAAKDRCDELVERLSDLQEIMFAQDRHAVLVVFQAMDAGGKDSTIRSVFSPVNPQGCRVWSFKKPSAIELAHDYLWRIHERTPPRGMISVFNRSHYESVLVERVKSLVPVETWQRRYEHINQFEQRLVDEGTTILKFYLHISRDYQRQQFQDRLDTPRKQWKFNPGDLDERARWDDYMAAFEDALSRCSTAAAPWYVVPAERKWFRNLLVSQVIVETMERFGMDFPKPDFDPSQYVIE